MFSKKYITLSLILMLSACATVLSGTNQNIHVRVLDDHTQQVVEGASCNVTNSKGNWAFTSAGNTLISVIKGGGVLVPHCAKAGYKQTNYSFGESFNKTTLVNVLFWPGFLIDMASGATREYPSHMIVYMTRN